ncbi:rhomboid family intramembrane serine protease [Leptospira sp. GIMC2001]|uniref:rhomboid family intramembrane serine protease n=1 Tax=Leptospira sp. GIMC2001 TaxID=1513297 RepID=UPI00234B0094|nr:rhomboid family intramembrane serine protease [Leptospira sp. GIMC2001]WCL48677.1 rhomboid family intramembrane serine protease [Leptospira sp. GIMC2001]
MASPYGYQLRFGPSLTPVVRNLIIINAILFVLQFFTNAIGAGGVIESIFALNSAQVSNLWVWQLLTYAFLHADIVHILFNMLFLWMFGSELENFWNSDIFLKFYLFCCLVGGVFSYVGSFITGPTLVLGASGGVYGAMLAYAMVWPNRELLVMGIIPMKAKYFILIPMVLIFFSQSEHIAHAAHAGGLAGGFLFVKFFDRFRNYFNWSFSPSRYLQRRRMRKYQEEMEMRTNAKEKVDELLEKISKQGMNSLSRKEKNFLNTASKEYFEE